MVGDTGRAPSRLGRAARDRLGDRVVGITGSVGKTTVKELVAGALATTFRTAASPLSFNNEIGVPLTLANAVRGDRGDRRRDGGPGARAHPPAVRRRPAHHRRGHPGGPRPHRAVREPRRRWPRPRPNWSRPSPLAARPSSTPTTRGWRPWPRAPTPGCVLFGRSTMVPTCGPSGRGPRRAGPGPVVARHPRGLGRCGLALHGHHQVSNALAAAAAALAAGVAVGGGRRGALERSGRRAGA